MMKNQHLTNIDFFPKKFLAKLLDEHPELLSPQLLFYAVIMNQNR